MPAAVILAGGSGERFWPLTKPGFPKYRLRFDGKESLLGGTVRRLRSFYRASDIYVVTTADHAALIRKELPKLSRSNLLVEPSRNNTAAAIYFSMSVVEARAGKDEVVSFYPADHLIRDRQAFETTMKAAVRLAAHEDVLVTVGVKPRFPATGYGYIECSKPVRGHAGAFRAKRFVEKPDPKTAGRYLRAGHFLWNAGIFAWRASSFFEAMLRAAPEFARRFDPNVLRASYRRLPSRSIDYALMEKAENIVVVKTAMDWCDMGNWDMFYEKSSRDAMGNLVRGRVAETGCRGSLLYNAAPDPLVVSGLENAIVVRTERGTLVCPRGSSESAARFAAAPRA